VKGHVTDGEKGDPVAGVEVSIQDWVNSDGSTPKAATTDGRGAYHFDDLRPPDTSFQEVRLMATKPGYRTALTDAPLGATNHPIKLYHRP
jgi:hypothetical protein